MKPNRPLLIHGGTVVTPDAVGEADVLVTDGRIRAVGKDLLRLLKEGASDVTEVPLPQESTPALAKAAAHLIEDVEVVDAEGLMVLPGVIDAHTHIELDTGVFKTPDDWFTETRAAAYGGVTTVIDFATQYEGQSLREAVEARLTEAAPAAIDYAFHVMVTDLPHDREGELSDLLELGTPSIKVYTTYRPNYYVDDATVLRLLEAAGRRGIVTLVHCENDAIVTARTQALVDAGKTALRYHAEARPAFAEQEAAHRVLFLARAADAPVVIVHNSTALTSALVAEARDEGQVVYSETAPQYLVLDERAYESDEPWRYILQPPLREPEEKEGLWYLLSAGAIDMLITDHCDYTKAQKQEVEDFTRTAGGLPGLETLLPLTVTYGVDAGWLTWSDAARLLAENPAKIYGLWPRKGALLPGSDADLVLYDPEPEGEITHEDLHTIAGYTPYEGLRVKGRVVATLRRGEFLVRDGEFVGERGGGQFLEREPHPVSKRD